MRLRSSLCLPLLMAACAGGQASADGTGRAAAAPADAASAVALAQQHFALIEQGRRVDAAALWADKAEAARFAAVLNGFKEIHGEFGPARYVILQDGTAKVPARIYGIQRDGEPISHPGYVLARRVGSDWRIVQIELQAPLPRL